MTVSSRLRWHPKRSDAWWIALGGLLAVAGAAALLWLIPDDYPQPLKQVLAVAGGTGIGGVVSGALKQWAGRRDTNERVLAKSLGGAIPIFAHLTDTQLGVHPSFQKSDEFLERDATSEVCEALEMGQPILLVGPSMAGKSRLAVEAVRRTFPRSRALVPETAKSLIELLDEAWPTECIIWLDDLEKFLTGGLTRRRLERLVKDKNVIIGTIRTTERSKFLVDRDSKPVGWDVFTIFKEIQLATHLSQGETQALQNSGYSHLERQTGSFGLAEYLGGAPVAWDAFQRGESTNPLGWASIRAAADWYRVLREAIPDSALEELAPSYLPTHYRNHTFDRDQELAWASKAYNETIQVLRRASNDSWIVLDYITDTIESTDLLVHNDLWTMLDEMPIDSISAALAGSRARVEEKTDLAIRFLEQARNCSDDDVRLTSILVLGDLHSEVGNIESAEECFLEVLASRDEDAAPLAAGELGDIKQRQGLLTEAERFYKLALTSGHSWAAPISAFHLACMLEEVGDAKKAALMYRRTIEFDHPEASPRASVKLGLILESEGKMGEAADLYETTIDRGESQSAVRAHFNLGQLLEESGNYDKAIMNYRKAIDLEDNFISPRASIRLGQVLTLLGRESEASKLYQIMIDNGHSWGAPAALYEQGGILAHAGDTETAEELFQKAIKSAHTQASILASFSLGLIRKSQGRDQEAKDLFQKVVDSDEPKAFPLAAAALAAAYESDGSLNAAEMLYKQTVDARHPRASPASAWRLGIMAEKAGELQSAAAYYQIAFDYDDEDISAPAAFSLGILKEHESDLDGAIAMYRYCMQGTNPEVVGKAAIRTGLIYQKSGRAREARRLFQQGADTLFPNQSPRLGEILRAIWTKHFRTTR